MATEMAGPSAQRGGRQGGRPALDDEGLVFETTAGVEVVTTFDGMGIKDDLLRGIYAYGFEKPSAIQQRAVIPIISGRDVIAQAQSGTGKTSMIALTVCQILDTTNREYDFVSLCSFPFFGAPFQKELFCNVVSGQSTYGFVYPVIYPWFDL